MLNLTGDFFLNKFFIFVFIFRVLCCIIGVFMILGTLVELTESNYQKKTNNAYSIELTNEGSSSKKGLKYRHILRSLQKSWSKDIWKFSTSVELESENVCVSVCVPNTLSQPGTSRMIGFDWNFAYLFLEYLRNFSFFINFEFWGAGVGFLALNWKMI